MKKYFRVSLLMIILLMIVSAVWASYFGQRKLVLDLFQKVALIEREKTQLSEELTIARDEAQRLRVELGYFEVEDDSLIHALKLSDINPTELHWQYRVFLPEGKRFYAACQLNALPNDQSIPQLDSQISPAQNQSETKRISNDGFLVTLPSGHAKIKIALEKKDESFQLLVNIEGVDGKRKSLAGGELSQKSLGKWPYRNHPAMSETGVKGELVTQKDRIVLLNRRMFGEEVNNSADATEGILLWIDCYE